MKPEIKSYNIKNETDYKNYNKVRDDAGQFGQEPDQNHEKTGRNGHNR